jgi:predicted porin
VHLSQAVGQNEFLVHYAQARHLRCSGNANTGQCAPSNVNATGAKQWSLAYHYFFSKRTMLQAYWTRISNDAQGRYDFDVNPVVNDVALRAPGADPTGIGAGIRHGF